MNISNIANLALLNACRQIFNSLSYYNPNGESALPIHIVLDTTNKDLKLPQQLIDNNPQQITLVLQHKFKDLKVSNKGVSVILFFQQIPHECFLPYEAMLQIIFDSLGSIVNINYSQIPNNIKDNVIKFPSNK